MAQRARVVAAMALLVCASSDARAASHGQTPAGQSSYAMTAWAAENGDAPGDVFAIAQDLRGYLWLGTNSGLVRFDGDRFRRWPVEDGDEALPAGPVYALLGASDGSLWVSLSAGLGVARILDGVVTQYTPADGAPSTVSSMIQDREGAIWVASRRGVVRFVNGHWSPIGHDGDTTSVEAFSLFEDREGTIWVGSAAGVYRLKDGVATVIDESARQVDALAEDGSGTMWISDYDRGARRLVTRETPVAGPGVRGPAGAWRMLRDSSGQLWVATWASLMRINHPEVRAPVIYKVDYEHRMAGSPRALYEDREGNIWVGMRGGLLRLSRTSLTAVSQLDGLTNEGVRTTAASPDGSIWVATAYALNRFTGTSRTAYDISHITALHADRDDLWVSTPDQFGRFVNGRLVPINLPGSFHPRRVLSMTTLPDGTLWLCSALDGPMSWDGHHLDRLETHPEIFNRACHSIYADSRGRVWMGFLEGGAAVYDRGMVSTFDSKDGLTAGTILAILEDQRGTMWMSTSAGVNRYAGGRFTSVGGDAAPLTDLVPLLLEDDEGYLWVGVNSGAGVVRFHPRQFDNLGRGDAQDVEYAYFDETDGMQKGSQAWQAGVGGVRGADGRLWVATGVGMAVIDPDHLPALQTPPPPRIEAMNVDGSRRSMRGGTSLPSRTSTVEFEYGSVALSSASKLRYRYRLDGVDDRWVPAGGARRATYTGLSPGAYRFRVSATDTGRWTEESILSFTVLPPFYRTPQFIVFAAVAGVLIVIAAWWMRLRAVQRRYSLVFAERARVSREIHDTLLQSLAAIGVELETIASQVEPSHGTLRSELARLRRQVGHSLRDARDSILELRRSPLHQRPLAESLKTALQSAPARHSHAPVDIELQGRPRETPASVDAQIVRIAQEAVSNALKHSHASSVDVTLSYEPTELVLRVEDDGCGFDPQSLDSSSEVGEHLGLLTMQERAMRIGGHLTIDSHSGAGTRVALSLPLDSDSRKELS